MSEVDWLSHLLQIVTVTGQLEVRGAYGAPWRVGPGGGERNSLPRHRQGPGHFEDPETRTLRELVSGDIVLLPHGASHVLHDGSGQTPIPTQQRQGSAGWMLSENDGQGEQLDSKLRGCDLVKMKIGSLVTGTEIRTRAMVATKDAPSGSVRNHGRFSSDMFSNDLGWEFAGVFFHCSPFSDHVDDPALKRVCSRFRGESRQ
jgi:AraC family transcriptional activator of mtrCDE